MKFHVCGMHGDIRELEIRPDKVIRVRSFFLIF